MDNAGGVQVRERAIRLAAEEHEVTLVVPDYVQATPAQQGLPPSINVVKCPSPPSPATPWLRAWEFAERTLNGEITPGSRWRRGWLSTPVREILTGADHIEVHWSAFLPLVQDIRPIAPNARLYAVEHDVQVQGLARRALFGSGSLRRVAARIATRTAKRREPRFCNLYDDVVTYSRKDADLLRALGVHRPITEAHFFVPIPSTPATLDSRTVLFTGAMYRPENQDAARWLIDEIWPLVLARAPEARLVVAGAGPPADLTSRASHDVKITGFVEDLTACYLQARVFVAPLRLGAGVKVKVQEAMSAGVPVVASPVAAEGFSPRLLRIATTPASIADEISWLLLDDPLAHEYGQAGRQWALARIAGSLAY